MIELLKEEKEEEFEKIVTQRKWKDNIITIVSTVYVLFTLYEINILSISPLKQRAIFLTLTLFLIFFTSSHRKKIGFAINMVLLVLSIVIGLYVFIEHDSIIERTGAPITLDIILGYVAVILVIEATRRTCGWGLPILSILFIIYAYFGPYMPITLGHRGYEMERIVTHLYLTLEGIYGVALQVMMFYVFIFVVFGTILAESGGIEFFIGLAQSLAGKYSGGPAKISVLSSALFGTISGSAAANVVVDGVITIPLMKRIGYKPYMAGAIEAATSTGGQIMPPVMGAGAFVMAEFLGIPYISIAKAAAFPAILYFFYLYVSIHYEAKKGGLKGLPKEELPKLMNVLKQWGIYLLPLILLIYVLVAGYSPIRAGIVAIFVTILVGLPKKSTRVNYQKFIKMMRVSAKNVLAICSASACAGIIISIVGMTGLGLRISGIIIDISGGILPVALAFTMIVSFIFGMGLPTVVVYILLATMVAPSLINMGAQPLQAHLFIFYSSIMSQVTPPVAFAAYAAAALAESNPVRTGFAASRLSLPAYIVPFVFIYNAGIILKGSYNVILLSIILSLIGLFAIGIGATGYMIRKTTIFERIGLIFGGIMIMFTSKLFILLGLVLIGLAIFIQLMKGKKKEISLREGG